MGEEVIDLILDEEEESNEIEYVSVNAISMETEKELVSCSTTIIQSLVTPQSKQPKSSETKSSGDILNYDIMARLHPRPITLPKFELEEEEEKTEKNSVHSRNEEDLIELSDTETLPLPPPTSEEQNLDDEEEPILFSSQEFSQEEEEEDDLLDFNWRSSSSKLISSSSLDSKQEINEEIDIIETVESNSSNRDIKKNKRRASPNKENNEEEKKIKKPRKMKTGKTVEEKFEIAWNLGKYAHLELELVAHPNFFKTPVGYSVEFQMIDQDRKVNFKPEPNLPDDLVLFKRYDLKRDESVDQISRTNRFKYDKLAILIWKGESLINDLLKNETTEIRFNQAANAKKYIEIIQPDKFVNFIVVLEDCDKALRNSKVSVNNLEDFLVIRLGAELGISHVHCKTEIDVATFCCTNFKLIEKFPYKQKGNDFLDLVQKFKSFSSTTSSLEQLEEESQKITHRAIDSTQLYSIWTNQLRTFPRISEGIAERIAEKFKSFKDLYEAFQENPNQTEQDLQDAGGSKKLRKVAKTIRTVFTCSRSNEAL